MRGHFFLYEEFRAMKEAVEKVGLGAFDVENLFYNNAKNLIESTGFFMAGAGASE
mgnify:FL=1